MPAAWVIPTVAGEQGQGTKDEAPCRKPCQVLAPLTPSCTSPRQQAGHTGLQGLPGAGRLLPAPCPRLGEQQHSAGRSWTSLCCGWTGGTGSYRTAGRAARPRAPPAPARASPAHNEAGYRHPTEQQEPRLQDWGRRRLAERQIYLSSLSFFGFHF